MTFTNYLKNYRMRYYRMENLEEKYNELKIRFHEIVEKNAMLDEKLEKYNYKIIPAFSVGQELFCLNAKKREIVPLKVDEIIINKFGVAYREYTSETEFKQFPEVLCFENKIDANESLSKTETKN